MSDTARIKPLFDAFVSECQSLLDRVVGNRTSRCVSLFARLSKCGGWGSKLSRASSWQSLRRHCQPRQTRSLPVSSDSILPIRTAVGQTLAIGSSGTSGSSMT